MTKEPAPAAAPAEKAPRPPPWWRTLRADAPILIRALIGIAFVALIFVVWWLLTRGGVNDAYISSQKLPGPHDVFVSTKSQIYPEDAPRDANGRVIQQYETAKTLPSLIDRDLDLAIYATMKRVFTGVLLAALVGIGLGVLAGSYRAVAAAFNPVVVFLRSVPMGALLPITLLMFGTGENQKEKFIFLAVLPFVFSDTLKAIAGVPQRYVETAETLGASKFQIIRKVLFPLALPDIITSLRFQFGLALGYITLAEAVNTNQGLGKLLELTSRYSKAEMYLLLFVIATIAFTIDLGIRFFQRGIFHYRKDL